MPRYATLRALKLPELQEALTPYHEAVHIEIEKALDSYQRVTTDNRALEVGQQEILPLVDYFEAQHVQGFVQAIVHNQSKVIIKTYQSEPIIEEVFVKTAHLLDECRASWQQLLTTLGSQNLYGGYIQASGRPMPSLLTALITKKTMRPEKYWILWLGMLSCIFLCKKRSLTALKAKLPLPK